MQANAIVTIGQGEAAVRFGNDQRLSVMAGPCALESRQHALEMAAALKEIAARLKIGVIDGAGMFGVQQMRRPPWAILDMINQSYRLEQLKGPDMAMTGLDLTA